MTDDVRTPELRAKFGFAEVSSHCFSQARESQQPRCQHHHRSTDCDDDELEAVDVHPEKSMQNAGILPVRKEAPSDDGLQSECDTDIHSEGRHNHRDRHWVSPLEGVKMQRLSKYDLSAPVAIPAGIATQALTCAWTFK